MKKFSAFISLLAAVFLTASCSIGFSVQKADGGFFGGSDDIQYFSLKAGRRTLTGTLVTRPVEGGFRAVGSSEFGMTLFDITVYQDSYEVNSCADFLKKDKLLDTIADQLRDKLMKEYITTYSI
jgi:hypothetical protein